ncbi:MAG: sterol desaturase family protein [Gammaproteobacteria bacterium]
MLVDDAKSWLLESLGPQLYQAASWFYWTLLSPVLFGEPRLHWATLASAAIIAMAFYYLHVARSGAYRGPLSYLAPSAIYTHPSSLLDFKYFVILQLVVTHLKLGMLVTGLIGMLHVGDGVTRTMHAVMGAGPGWSAPSGLAIAGFTLCMLLAADCGKWVAHYALHKVPVLWEFHKVHHAAEVLNPITGFRVHPLEQMLDFSCRLVLSALVAGIFAWFYRGGIAEATILSFNAIAALIYLPIAKLQHSHVAIGYGSAWSRWLISPLMHQVHHSAETRHWDRNMGFTFSIWDRMAGTLYVPQPGEQFRLGLPKGNEGLDSVWRLFVQPFIKVYRRPGPRPTPL